jgi:hypothetical protein
MVTPDRKVRKLMTEYEKTGNLTKAARGRIRTVGTGSKLT